MFDLIPFRRTSNDLFDLYNDMEKSLSQNFNFDFPSFKTDIVDKGDKFILEADLPGFKKEDIDIDIDGNMLTISAKHSEKREENKDNYIRRERRYGSFTRSFDVSNIKTNDIKAEYKDGVLTLELPKINKEGRTGRKISIQ